MDAPPLLADPELVTPEWLTQVVRHGGAEVRRDCEDYRGSRYASLFMAVFASMTVGRTDRGDAMFMAMANRSAQMAVDLDAHRLITS